MHSVQQCRRVATGRIAPICYATSYTKHVCWRVYGVLVALGANSYLCSVRAVINLEGMFSDICHRVQMFKFILYLAAGTTGRELLFQATSEEMIRAYSHAPRPLGTIVANEVFSSGIILSE